LKEREGDFRILEGTVNFMEEGGGGRRSMAFAS